MGKLRRFRALSVVVCVVVSGSALVRAGRAGQAVQPQAVAGRGRASPERALLDRYCVTCHNARLKTAGLSLDDLDIGAVGSHAETWEKVLRKIRAGQMPPVGRPRPDAAAAAAFTTTLAA